MENHYVLDNEWGHCSKAKKRKNETHLHNKYNQVQSTHEIQDTTVGSKRGIEQDRDAGQKRFKRP